jgi:hypothetical protein
LEVVGEGEQAVTKDAKRLPVLKQKLAGAGSLGESRQAMVKA